MTTGIFIPSKGRVGRVVTLGAVPASWALRAHLVVPVEQAKDYMRAYAVSVLAVPAKVVSIGPTRQWIVDWAAKHGFTKVIMMDDDLTFAARRVDDPTRFTTMTREDHECLLTAIEDELNTYAHVSVLAREGGNRVLDPRRYNSRPLRVYAYNLAMLKESGCRFTQDPDMFMDDFDMTLQLLRKGYSNAIICNYVNNQGGSNAAGGASLLRTAAKQAESARKLAAAHPGFVKVVVKNTKTAWGWGERTDVVISWKKARERA